MIVEFSAFLRRAYMDEFVKEGLSFLDLGVGDLLYRSNFEKCQHDKKYVIRLV